MLPESVATGLRGNVGRGLAIATVLAMAWLLAVRQGGDAEPARVEPAAGFQPVPNTSPVPADFLLKQPTPAPAAASAEPTPADRPSPPRTEFKLFQSAALARPMHYLVYEPAGYESSPERRYPVLYMLHGIGGGFGSPTGLETEWPGYGLLAAADRLIAGGDVQPLLIVLPQGDQSYWMDAANGGPRYADYVTDDLVSEIDGHFRTLADARHRAVGGLSMGGFGALSLAMRRPDVFSIAGAHSPSLARLTNGPAFFGDTAHFARYDPVALMAARPDMARSLRLWLEVADHDPLWKTATEDLHQQLLADGIPHEWREWPGKHDGLYWGAHMGDYLRFYSAALSS